MFKILGVSSCSNFNKEHIVEAVSFNKEDTIKTMKELGVLRGIIYNTEDGLLEGVVLDKNIVSFDKEEILLAGYNTTGNSWCYGEFKDLDDLDYFLCEVRVDEGLVFSNKKLMFKIEKGLFIDMKY